MRAWSYVAAVVLGVVWGACADERGGAADAGPKDPSGAGQGANHDAGQDADHDAGHDADHDASGGPDGAPPDADGAHHPEPTEPSVRCASELPDDPFEGARAQRYRFEAPLDRRASVVIQRGGSMLFADEDMARAFASDDPSLGTARFTVELLAELDGDGALQLAWQGSWDEGSARLARSSEPGVYEGQAAFAGDTRGLVCWREVIEPRFRYDPASGECRSVGSERGRRALPLLYVLETGDGECNDFGAVELSTFNWPVLAGWNLRGADLARATASFATMPEADFSGARLGGFTSGYFGANGRADRHTQEPTESFPMHRTADEIAFGEIGVPMARQPPYFAWLVPCATRPLATRCVDIDR